MLSPTEKEQYITERLTALKAERDALEAQYEAGSLSRQDYERECAKNDFLVAEITERNAQSFDQEQEQAHGRNAEWLGD